MSHKHNGGHAYPTQAHGEKFGVTKRDAFAIAALPAIMPVTGSTGPVSADNYEHYARLAYAMADAMIAERDR